MVLFVIAFQLFVGNRDALLDRFDIENDIFNVRLLRGLEQSLIRLVVGFQISIRQRHFAGKTCSVKGDDLHFTFLQKRIQGQITHRIGRETRTLNGFENLS